MLPIVSWLISIEFDTRVASPTLYGITSMVVGTLYPNASGAAYALVPLGNGK
jgi:hypothetical protein